MGIFNMGKVSVPSGLSWAYKIKVYVPETCGGGEGYFYQFRDMPNSICVVAEIDISGSRDE